MPKAAVQEKADRKPRGTYPPFLRLSEATELAQKVSDNAAGEASYELFSSFVDNSVRSSTFHKKVAALRMYGIAEDRNNVVALSEIGQKIAAPTHFGEADAARKMAMQRIEVLNRLYERHKGRLLPEDQYLRNIVEQELKIPRDVSDDWVIWFKDALSTSGLLMPRQDGKTQVLENALQTKEIEPPPTQEVPPTRVIPEAGAVSLNYAVDSDQVIPFSLGRGRLVRVELPKDWDSTKDLPRLLKMLQLSLSEDEKQEPND